jgi:hypothetical protein
MWSVPGLEAWITATNLSLSAGLVSAPKEMSKGIEADKKCELEVLASTPEPPTSMKQS